MRTLKIPFVLRNILNFITLSDVLSVTSFHMPLLITKVLDTFSHHSRDRPLRPLKAPPPGSPLPSPVFYTNIKSVCAVYASVSVCLYIFSYFFFLSTETFSLCWSAGLWVFCWPQMFTHKNPANEPRSRTLRRKKKKYDSSIGGRRSRRKKKRWSREKVAAKLLLDIFYFPPAVVGSSGSFYYMYKHRKKYIRKI